jgi:hypothetical protein
LRRPRTVDHPDRLRTIRTAQRRLAAASLVVAAMLVVPQPEVRLVLGWLLLAVVWATVPALLRSRELAGDPLDGGVDADAPAGTTAAATGEPDGGHPGRGAVNPP